MRILNLVVTMVFFSAFSVVASTSRLPTCFTKSSPLATGTNAAPLSLPTPYALQCVRCFGLNRYAVAEADIPIKTRHSASTSPRDM